ncbi:MAG: hypothetical protein JWM05_3729, partial [Acidimicrobiales bacterium]|nr:hypothetical protein [Acidimicrobiales bacterium]
MTAVDEGPVGSARTGKQPLLEVEGLQKYFPVNRGIIFQKQVGAVKA